MTAAWQSLVEFARLTWAFGRRRTGRFLAVVALLLLAGLFEVLGVLALLPVIGITVGAEGQRSDLEERIFSAVEFIGLPTDLTGMCLVVSLIFALKAVLRYLALRLSNNAMIKVRMEYRTRYLDQILRSSWQFFRTRETGRLTNALMIEADQAGNAMQMVTMCIAAAIQACAYLATAIIIEPVVALLAIVTASLSMVLLGGSFRKTTDAGRSRARQLNTLSSAFVEYLNNLKPMKAMNREAWYRDIVLREVEALQKSLRRKVNAKAFFRSFQEPIQAIVLLWGIYVAITWGEVPFTELVILVVVFWRAMVQINKVQGAMQSSIGEGAALWSLFAAIDDAKRHKERHPGTGDPDLSRGLRLRDVGFKVDNHRILDDVTIEARPGEITALVGPSGSGKTTITDIVLGLVAPTRGEVLLGDRPLRDVSLTRLRAQVGYVGQDVVLASTSVRDNLRMGESGYDDADLWRCLEAADATDFVRAMPDGLDSPVGERGALLSGGQRQRLAIARALLRQPRLLILDEVTSALDPETARRVGASLRRLEDDMIVLVVTHSEELATFADRIYRIDRGRVVASEHRSLRPEPASTVG